MTPLRQIALLLMAVMAMGVLTATSSFAQTVSGAGGGTAAAPPAATATAGTAARTSFCDQYVGLSNRIAGCVRATITDAAGTFFTGFYPLVSRAIAAVLTIAVAIFGVMAAMGMIERPPRDTFMVIIKIAMVAFFTTNIDFAYNKVLLIMDASAQAAVRFVPASGNAENSQTNFSSIQCLQTMKKAQADSPTGPVVGPWLGIDCVVDSVIGIKLEPKASSGSATSGVIRNFATDTGAATTKYYNDKLSSKDSGPSRGMLNFFFSSMQTSVLGIMVAIIGFIFIYGLIFLIIKALFIYLTGYLGITFLMILGPIFIPLVMFQVTKQYFDKWARLMISFALQPIIILIFISFSIAAIDLATFSGKYSIMYRLAGDASTKPDFSLNKYLDENGVITKAKTEAARIKTAGADVPVTGVTEKGVLNGINQTKCLKSAMANDPELKKECDKSFPVSFLKNSMDWEKLASVRQPPVTLSAGAPNAGAQIAREVLSSVIFCGIVLFVMNALLKIIPSVAFDLLGDFNQTPNLGAISGKLPGQDNLKSAATSLQGALGGLVGKR